MQGQAGQAGERSLNCERRPHCTLGIVLLRHRVAEQRHQPGESLDKLFEAGQLRRDNERRNDILDAIEKMALAKRLLLLAGRLRYTVTLPLSARSRLLGFLESLGFTRQQDSLYDMTHALDAHIEDAKVHLRQFYERR